MATRKIFSDLKGKELGYHLTPDHELKLEINFGDSHEEITLNPADSREFILELNKLKKSILN